MPAVATAFEYGTLMTRSEAVNRRGMASGPPITRFSHGRG
jgi:hypothetical protein